MAHPPNIFCAGRVSQRPMVHLGLRALGLSLPDRVHENIDGTLSGRLCTAVEHRHAEDYRKALLARPRKFAEHGTLTVELSLPVKVRWSRSSIALVGCIAWRAGEDVVRRDVDDKDVPGSSELSERLARSDVERLCALGIIIDLVWEALRST